MPRLSLQVMGTAVEIDVPFAEVADQIARAWARCERPAAGGSTQPGSTVELADDSSSAGALLATRLTVRGIEGLAGSRLLFHPAGLAADDGRVILVVGRSGAGKTTAAAHLCRSRFGYVSDEAIAVDQDFTVTPYPKPLLIRRGDWPKSVVGPDELDLRNAPPSLTATGLVLLHRDGSRPPRLEPLPLLEAVLALTPETSALGRLPEPLQKMARLIEHCGGAWALHYGEIGDAESLLGSLLDAPSSSHDVWAPVESKPHPDGLPGDERICAVEVQDAVVVGDEVLLLWNGRPVHLRGIGATTWLTARGGATEPRLLREAVQMHGAHPHARRLVRAAVDEMVLLGVLERC